MAAARKSTAAVSTKASVFDSAAGLFSDRGFDGVSIDDIARDAGVNKAMIYYHYADKLALYRAVLADGLTRMGATVSAIASSSDGPATKLDRFIEAFVRMTETRPWMPALMLREIAEGAPRLDAGGTLRDARMKFERECISAALVRHHGRVGEAAKALGIQRTNLYRKVRQLKVDKALLSSQRS